MTDLCRDVERLPALGMAKAAADGDAEAAPSDTAAEKSPDPVTQAAAPAVPEELAGLASNWDSLPEHIRNAIVSLGCQ